MLWLKTLLPVVLGNKHVRSALLSLAGGLAAIVTQWASGTNLDAGSATLISGTVATLVNAVKEWLASPKKKPAEPTEPEPLDLSPLARAADHVTTTSSTTEGTTTTTTTDIPFGLLLAIGCLFTIPAWAGDAPRVTGYTLHLSTDTGPFAVRIPGPPAGVSVSADGTDPAPIPVPPGPNPTPEPNGPPGPGKFGIAPRVYELAKQANDKAGAALLAGKSEALAAKIEGGAISAIQEILLASSDALLEVGESWTPLKIVTKAKLQELVLSGLLSVNDPKSWAPLFREFADALRRASR